MAIEYLFGYGKKLTEDSKNPRLIARLTKPKKNSNKILDKKAKGSPKTNVNKNNGRTK